jgi:hypothetical protein
MSRNTIPARLPGLTVVVGWDNPMGTFFAQVEREQGDDCPREPAAVARHRPGQDPLRRRSG